MDARGSPLIRWGGFFIDPGGAEGLELSAALPAGPVEANGRRCGCMGL